MTFAYDNPLNGSPLDQRTPTSIPVSHTNTLVKDSSTKIVLWGNVAGGYSTPDQAKNHHFSNGMGVVDCSQIDDEIKIEKRDLWIQASSAQDDGFYVTINRINSDTIGVKDLDVTTADHAREGIDTVISAQQIISEERTNIGAQQNRLEHSYNNNRNIEENTTASESRIRDTDMASEMVKYANNNILAQAGQAILSQANQTNQAVLSLLQ